MQKSTRVLLKMICLTGMIGNVLATGMAVGLNNLYLQNNTDKNVTLEISNLPPQQRMVLIVAKSSCKINSNLVFMPFPEEQNDFVIMLKNAQNVNPIVIDKNSTLSLASNAELKFNYSGNVHNYQLSGYCNNKLVNKASSSIAVISKSQSGSLPVFVLNKCKLQSNYLYVINDKSITPQVKLDFNKITICQTTK